MTSKQFDQMIYLMSQQHLSIPPILISGTSTGNTIKLIFYPEIDFKDYICSIQAVSFGLSNVEFNITSANNTISYIDSSGTPITITIPPGIYEFTDVNRLLATLTGGTVDANGNITTPGAIQILMNTNTGQINVIVAAGYTLNSSPLFVTPNPGMFLGFADYQFPILDLQLKHQY